MKSRIEARRSVQWCPSKKQCLTVRGLPYVSSPQSSTTDVPSWPKSCPSHEKAHSKTSYALSQASLQQHVTCPLLAKHHMTQQSLKKLETSTSGDNRNAELISINYGQDRVLPMVILYKSPTKWLNKCALLHQTTYFQVMITFASGYSYSLWVNALIPGQENLQENLYILLPKGPSTLGLVKAKIICTVKFSSLI